MLRKLILAVAVATLIGPSAISAATDIAPPTRPRHQFKVFVQRGSGWQLHGTYPLHAEARRVAIRLWHEGYRVEIWEV